MTGARTIAKQKMQPSTRQPQTTINNTKSKQYQVNSVTRIQLAACVVIFARHVQCDRTKLLQRDAVVGHRQSETRAGNHQRHTRTRNVSLPTQANYTARGARKQPPNRGARLHFCKCNLVDVNNAHSPRVAGVVLPADVCCVSCFATVCCC